MQFLIKLRGPLVLNSFQSMMIGDDIEADILSAPDFKIFDIYQNLMIDYYSEDNPPTYEKIPPFRFVKPYEHVYNTRAKGRWVKKNILDAMEEEFKAYDREYYVNVKELFRLKLSQTEKFQLIKRQSPHPILSSINDQYKRNGDDIEHRALRNEPPILDVPIAIVYEDDEYLVVSKPPSMIVHTGGGYHYNTLMGILFFEMGKRNLHVLHRLDRLTSGLLMFAKNKDTAKQWHTALGEKTIGKNYYARVVGNFPEDIHESQRYIYCVSMKEAIFACCDEKEAEDLKGKPAHTKFKKIWYDDKTDTSLVDCQPITGKTHQIRVHLKDLGYPIINDIGYGGKMIGNKILSIHFKSLDFKKIKQKLMQEPLEDDIEKQPTKKIKTSEDDGVTVSEQKQAKEVEISPYKIFEWDYKEHPLEIYLHSYRYQFGEKIFQSDPPYWAEKNLPIDQF